MRRGCTDITSILTAAAFTLVFAACADEAATELPPVGLAHHIDKLLSDPSPLPSQRTDLPAAATPDVPPAPEQDLAKGPGEGTDEAPDAGEKDEAAATTDAPEQPENTAAPEPPKAPKAGELRRKAPAPRPATKRPSRSRISVKRPAVVKRSRPPRTAPKPAPPPKMPAPPAGSPAPPPGLDATDLYHLGEQQLRQGKYSAAISSLAASHKLRPSKRTLTKLGQAYFDAHQLKKAEKVLRRAGTHAPAMLMLGTLYQQTGQQSRARQVYKAFLTKYPDHKRATWVRTILQAL